MESVENERLHVHEGDIKVCRDAVLHYFWCDFAEIYNLINTWYCAFIRLNSFKSFLKYSAYCVNYDKNNGRST